MRVPKALAGDMLCKSKHEGQLGVCRVRVPAEKKGVEDEIEGGEGKVEGGVSREGFKKRGGVGVHFCVGGRREEDGAMEGGG